MGPSLEDRVRMFENRLSQLEARIDAQRHLVRAHLRIVETRLPGTMEEAFEQARRQMGGEAAEEIAGAELFLEALINEIDQQFSLPAND